MAGRGKPKGSPKTGGRRPGSPNRPAPVVADGPVGIAVPAVLPLEWLLQIMNNTRVALTHRIRAATAAAAYCHPKLVAVAVEHGGAVAVEAPALSPTAEAAELIRRATAEAGLPPPADEGQDLPATIRAIRATGKPSPPSLYAALFVAGGGAALTEDRDDDTVH
jgi:hypothetical protein